MSAYTDKSRLFFLNLPRFSRQIHVQYSIVLFSRQVKKEVSVLDTPSSVSVHECSANPDILNHDARLNDVSPNDASPNDVSCPSCSPHRTGFSSVTPETNLFPGSHGLLSFPVQMTSWPVVGQLTAYTDATTGATPLAIMKGIIGGVQGFSIDQLPDSFSLLIGQNGGCIGEVSALALLIGLGYMLWKKIITWHIPVSILVTVFVFAGIMHLVDPAKYVSPVLQLLSGGLMLGAVFMATDYVTSPMSKKGMLIYGVCIGLLTVIIRLFGAYPEGMSFAILIMNAFTPLINTYCKPKRFGEVAKKK